jgi:hypothetical protein
MKEDNPAMIPVYPRDIQKAPPPMKKLIIYSYENDNKFSNNFLKLKLLPFSISYKEICM